MKLFTGWPLGAIMDTVLKLFSSAHFNWPKIDFYNRFNKQMLPMGDWTLFDSVWSILVELLLKSKAPIQFRHKSMFNLETFDSTYPSFGVCFFLWFAHFQLFSNGSVDVVCSSFVCSFLLQKKRERFALFYTVLHQMHESCVCICMSVLNLLPNRESLTLYNGNGADEMVVPCWLLINAVLDLQLFHSGPVTWLSLADHNNHDYRTLILCVALMSAHSVRLRFTCFDLSFQWILRNFDMHKSVAKVVGETPSKWQLIEFSSEWTTSSNRHEIKFSDV